MKVGSMVHCFCLEPNSFLRDMHFWTISDQKKVRSLALQLAESGRETFTTAEMTTFMGIYNALSRNDFAKKYVIDDTTGKAEQSFWWTHRETGLPCKARCDYVVDDMVIDLKTTGEGGANADKFTRINSEFSLSPPSRHILASNWELNASYLLQ